MFLWLHSMKEMLAHLCLSLCIPVKKKGKTESHGTMTDWNNGWRTCCCSKDIHGLFLCRPDLDPSDSSRCVAVHPPTSYLMVGWSSCWCKKSPPPSPPCGVFGYLPHRWWRCSEQWFALLERLHLASVRKRGGGGGGGAWPWRGGKEEARQCRPVHRRGERVMVSRCWPTLSDNCFLVCGSAWRDARRQEPSSAGCIPAGSRERAQPGRRVLLD